jgi:hypothetical protein
MAETGLLAAFRVIARAVAEAQSATRQQFVLCGAESNADATSPVSAATEAHGGSREAQGGRE